MPLPMPKPPYSHPRCARPPQCLAPQSAPPAGGQQRLKCRARSSSASSASPAPSGQPATAKADTSSAPALLPHTPTCPRACMRPTDVRAAHAPQGRPPSHTHACTQRTFAFFSVFLYAPLSRRSSVRLASSMRPHSCWMDSGGDHLAVCVCMHGCAMVLGPCMDACACRNGVYGCALSARAWTCAPTRAGGQCTARRTAAPAPPRPRPPHPKPLLSWKWSANSLAYTMSFLGTHPRSTHLGRARVRGCVGAWACTHAVRAGTCVCVYACACVRVCPPPIAAQRSRAAHASQPLVAHEIKGQLAHGDLGPCEGSRGGGTRGSQATGEVGWAPARACVARGPEQWRSRVRCSCGLQRVCSDGAGP